MVVAVIGRTGHNDNGHHIMENISIWQAAEKPMKILYFRYYKLVKNYRHH